MTDDVVSRGLAQSLLGIVSFRHRIQLHSQVKLVCIKSLKQYSTMPDLTHEAQEVCGFTKNRQL